MGKKDADGRFKKFGTAGFTSATKVNDFIGHLEKGRIAGTKCANCGKRFFPPRADCCRCLSEKMEWYDVSGTGKLLSYSRLEYAPAGFEGDLPYSVAVLDYGDCKVFGRIAPDLPDEEIRIGMDMKTEVNELPDGRLNYVFTRVSE